MDIHLSGLAWGKYGNMKIKGKLGKQKGSSNCGIF